MPRTAALPAPTPLGARARRARALLALLPLLALLTLLGAPPASAAPRPTWRLAVIVDRTGRLAGLGTEVLDGVRHAASGENAAPPSPRSLHVEVLPFDDAGRPEESVKAYEAAIKARADAVIAAPSGRCLEPFLARARKGKVPVLLVGSAPPRPSLDPKDPVAFLGAWPAEQAQFVAGALVTPCRAKKPGFLVEDTPRGHAFEVLLQKALPPGLESAGAVRVPAGFAPASALMGLRDAGCDRLVVVGEPDLLDAAVRALEAQRWEVPLLALDGALSASASAALTAPLDRVLFVVGSPQLVMTGPPRTLEEAAAAAGARGPVRPPTVRAWVAARLLLESALRPDGKLGKDAEVLAALRERRYGPEESHTTILDGAGYASLYRWALWRSRPEGPELVPSNLLPAEGFGPLLGTRKPSAYRAEAGTKYVWIGFGDEKSKPARTVERDLADLGLGTRGYEGNLDFHAREELLARVLGKLNRLFLKGEDGSAVPGVSFAVSFGAEKPKDLSPSQYFTVTIAGDDAVAGGRAFPGEGRAEVYLTYLRRTIFQPNALAPALSREDGGYFTGAHAWKGVPLEHARHDQIRALIDGLAGAIALTTAHEVGHLFGLGHDESDPRSIMNVAEGAGLRETQAVFIPAHAALLERAVGRWKDPATRR